LLKINQEEKLIYRLCKSFAALLAFHDQLQECDEHLFNKIKINKHHLLYKLLPPPSAASQFPYRTSHLTDSTSFSIEYDGNVY